MNRAYLERVARPCACNAPIVFAVTERGKRQPLNVEPDVCGNVAVHVDGAGTVRARVVTEERPVESYEELHVPHAATCMAQERKPAAPARPRSPQQLPPNVIPIYRARARRRARQQ